MIAISLEKQLYRVFYPKNKKICGAQFISVECAKRWHR